jgi:hypothetical protein
MVLSTKKYNELLDEYARAALAGLLAAKEPPAYNTIHHAFKTAQMMIELREQYAKKD